MCNGVADFYEFIRGETLSSAFPCYFLNGSLHWIGVIKLNVDAVTNKGRYHGALGVIAGDHNAQVLRAASCRVEFISYSALLETMAI